MGAANKLTTYDTSGFSGGANVGHDLLAEMAQYASAMAEAKADEMNYEKALQKLKTSNVYALMQLNKAEQQKYLEDASKAYNQLTSKQAAMRKKQLDDLYQEELAHSGALSDAEKTAMKERHDREIALIDETTKAKQKAFKENQDWEIKQKEKQMKKDNATSAKNAAKQLLSVNNILNSANRKEALHELQTKIVGYDEDGNEIRAKRSKAEQAGILTEAGLDKLASALSSYAQKLDGTIDKIGSYKGSIDTRLQGSSLETKGGSYWDKISTDLTEIASTSAIVKQSDIAEKVSSMVGQGIAFNVEQRATLEVMKDKIAGTFDATNATLLRLVRIQQQDTTAARLGMESALTSFLNNMYETSEYMQSIAQQVKSSLEEAASLMTSKSAVSFEYQVQKWLGSMYSVGMSDNTVQSISNALGQLAAGQLEGITSSGTGTLLVMAANEAGLNIADMLSEGLDESSTNQLMSAMVEYLSGIYDQTKDSKVLQQQFASVYNMTASDLKAIANLATSTSTVKSSRLSYASALGQLNKMASTMSNRTSTGEMLNNVMDNLQYTLSNGIATDPSLYGIYKLGTLTKSLTGGINIPSIMALGSGADLETTVADLMMSTALGASIIGNMGTLISGIGNAGSGTSILKKVGVGSGISTVSRGTGGSFASTSGISTSDSGGITVGNSSGSDIENATLTGANDSANESLANAVDSSEETKLSTVDEHIISIYNILQNIYDGQSLNVHLESISADAADTLKY